MVTIEWHERHGRYGLMGFDVVVSEGGRVRHREFVEQHSGAGLADEITVAPPKQKGGALFQQATIDVFCRGFYADPSKPSSYVPPGHCGTRNVTVQVVGDAIKVTASR